MNTINNRYLLIGHPENIQKGISMVEARDRFTETDVDLFLVDADAVPKQVLEYMESIYLKVENVHVVAMVKILDFQLVERISGERNHKKSYVLVLERKQRELMIRNAEGASYSQVLDWLISFIQTLNHLLLKGILWNYFDPRNVFLCTDENGERLLLRDPISAAITTDFERFSSYSLAGFGNYDPKGFDFSLQALGSLFMSVLIGGECVENFANELSFFKEQIRSGKINGKREVEIIAYILESLLNDSYIKRPLVFSDIIEDVNREFGTNYSSILIDEFQNLALSEHIILKDKYYREIESNYCRILGRESVNKLLLMDVNMEDRDHFVTDLIRRFSFLDVSVQIHRPDCEKEYAAEWIQKFESFRYSSPFIEEFGGREVFLEKYKAFLKDTRPLTKEHMRDKGILRLLTVAAKLLLENRGDEFNLYVFTNFEKLTPGVVATLYYALYFSKRHRTLLIGFSHMKHREDDPLSELQDALVSEGKVEKVSVQFLMHTEVKNFLRELFFQQEFPQDFVDSAYRITDGRPKLLLDFLMDCIREGILFFDEKQRLVSLREDYRETVSKCAMSDKDYRNYRFSDLSDATKNLAKLMSVVLLPHESKFFRQMLGVSPEEISIYLSELEKNHLVDIELRNGQKTYELTKSDPRLRSFLYNLLSTEEKKRLHQEAMSMINPESDEELFAFARHYHAIADEESLEKSTKIFIDLGDKYAEKLEYEKAIDFYSQSLDGKMDDEMRFRVYLSLFFYSYSIGRNEQVTRYVERLEELSKTQEGDLLAEFYGSFSLTYYRTGKEDEEKRERYFQEIEKMFHDKPTRTVAVYYYGILGRRELLAKNYDKSSEYYRYSIAQTGELPKFHSHVSFCYRHLALNAYYQSKYEECIRLNELSIQFARSGRDVRGEISAINNIAVAHEELNLGMEKAEDYYRENLRLSRQYGIAHTEIMSLLNLSFFENNRNNFRLAYEYAKASFMRSEETGERERKIHILKTLMHYSRRMGDLSVAYEYFREGEKVASARVFQDDHFGFYDEAQSLFFQLRNFDAVSEKVELNLSQFRNTHLSHVESTHIYRILCGIVRGECVGEEELLEILEKSLPDDTYDRRILIMELYEIALFLYSTGIIHKYSGFLEKLMEADGVYVQTYAFQVFFKRLNSKEISEEELNVLVEYVDRAERNNENIQLRCFLAEYYMNAGRPWEAAAMVFEAAQCTIDFLRNVPFADRKNVFEYNYYAKIFYYLEYFEEHRHFEMPEEEIPRTVSYDTLEKYLYRLDVDGKAMNLALPEHLNSERFRYEPYYKSLELAIAEFGDDFELNLKIILEAVARRIMVTEIYLCTMQDHVYHPNILLLNASEEKFADLSRMLDLSRMSIAQNLSSSDYRWKAILNIPIFSPDHDYNAEGMEASTVVIFATGKTVHRLDRKGYEEMKLHMSALSLLVENYQLSRMASIDRLTGALTRRSLDEELIYRFIEARRNAYPLTILMYDLDHFKKVNDTYGHTTGDTILRELAKVSMELLNGDAKVGRYGGEEFLAILPRKTEEEAEKLGEQLRNRVAEHVYKDLSDFHITVSIGISTLRDNQDTLTSLIERADEALYKAKSDGRNKVVIWKPGLEVKKTGSELAKGMFTGNTTKDASHQLAFLELLRDSSTDMSEGDAVFNILSRMLDVLEAYEVVVVSTHSKIQEGFSLRRGDMRLYDASMADQQILEEILASPGGFYRITWEEQSVGANTSGMNAWDSIMGLEIMDQGETIALMYLRVSLREKEFGKNDLHLATIFSTFLTEYL